MLLALFVVSPSRVRDPLPCAGPNHVMSLLMVLPRHDPPIHRALLGAAILLLPPCDHDHVMLLLVVLPRRDPPSCHALPSATILLLLPRDLDHSLHDPRVVDDPICLSTSCWSPPL
jgi:hypothetical protein